MSKENIGSKIVKHVTWNLSKDQSKDELISELKRQNELLKKQLYQQYDYVIRLKKDIESRDENIKLLFDILEANNIPIDHNGI